MDDNSILLLDQFDQEIETGFNSQEEEQEEEEEEEADVQETVDWKKLYDESVIKCKQYAGIIEQQMEMIKYMGDTVTRLGFTFDQLNTMLTD
jgi:hypothetical protein